MSAVKEEAAPYLAAFHGDPREPAWLGEIRREALARFGECGFPSRKEEAWRFTNLRDFASKTFSPSRRKPGSMVGMDTGLRRYGLEGSCRLVFLDGMFHSLSGDVPKGAWLGSTARAIEERPDLVRRAFDQSDLAGGQPFASLNAAYFGDGFILALEPGVAVDRPVEVIHIADGAKAESLHLRSAILLAPESRAVIVESFIGQGPYWTNAVTAIDLADRAALTHIKLQDEDRQATHFGLARVAIGAGAQYRNFGLTLGAELSRQDIHAALGDGAHCGIAGVYLQRSNQDTTNAIVIDHAAPNGTTRELFKGVLDEHAHGAFLGRISVRPDAQKTDAQQTSRALLLSDRASVDTKPELEILADDVKCSHGAAVGDLDRDMLFYLRARGIGADEARRMLIEAFVLEAIETVEERELRDHLSRQVRRWLGSFETATSQPPQDEGAR